MEMTEQQIAEEVQARLDFKLNELVVAIKNRAKAAWSTAFNSSSQKHSHYWEAFEQVMMMIEKERHMPPPYNEMALKNKRFKRDVAVQEILEFIIPRGTRRDDERHVVQKIVAAVEEAQNY